MTAQDCPVLLRNVQGCSGLSMAAKDCLGLLRNDKGCSVLSRAAQDCPGLLRIVQGCSVLSRASQECQELLRTVQCPGLLRTVQYYFQSELSNTTHDTLQTAHDYCIVLPRLARIGLTRLFSNKQPWTVLLRTGLYCLKITGTVSH